MPPAAPSFLRTTLRPALVLVGLFTLLTGLAYPLSVTALGQLLLPQTANGSLVWLDGRAIGSELVGQAFVGERYFRPRPSAAGATGYDAAASSGSNLGPTSKALLERVQAEVAALGGGPERPVPADAVTASGSGLDPHITPTNALWQVPRVAAVRGLPEPEVRALVEATVERPAWGLIGEPRVSVLRLNLALDRLTLQSARQPR